MSNVSEHIASIIHNLPETPGVYKYYNAEGTIIYVGKAKNLKRRVSSYFQKEHEWLKTRQLVRNITDIQYIVVDTEQDAFLLENNLIKQYQPHYNILLKDGKSYPSICITKEPYPRIFKTRTINKRTGEYYGPYSYSMTLDLVLELIHKLFPLRTCGMTITDEAIDKGKYKVCLKYHLHNCCGICEHRVTPERYAEWINQARRIIKGDAHLIQKQLEEEMLAYAKDMRYEEAGFAKEKLQLLEKFQSKTIITNSSAGDVDVFGYEEQEQNIYISMLHLHNGCIIQAHTIEYHRQLDETREEILAMGMHELREQLGSTTKDIIVPFIPDGFDDTLRFHIAISGDKKRLLDLAQKNVQQYKIDRLKQSDKLNPDQRAMRVLTELQGMLKLEKVPVFIDSFDNSNVQGDAAVAGCVVFKKGKPSKSDYKKFIIKTVVGADDYASMREVVRRRYAHLIEENAPLPDLIIADGGIGQMHAIREAVEDQLGLHIPIAGLKKDNKHRTQTLLYGFPPVEVGMAINSEVFRLMTKIQDEVHRFAITYHKSVRSKKQVRSQLDDIQGIGPATKQQILLAFGSVKNAGKANLEEWQQHFGKQRGSTLYNKINGHLTF